MAKYALPAILCAFAGCAQIPDVTFDDAGGSDAPASDLDAGDAGPIDATVADAGASDTGARDAELDSSVQDDAPPGVDAAVDADMDAATQDDASLACLPAKAPPNAGCCTSALPCVGLACGPVCSQCIAQGCKAKQFCCAVVDSTNTVTGVTCSANGKNCP